MLGDAKLVIDLLIEKVAAAPAGRVAPVALLWLHKLPIVFVVFRNGEYSILKSFAQLEEAPGVPGLDLPGLDVVSVAKGFGLRSVQAKTAEEIRDQFKLAVAADGPTVIVVDTQPQ